MFWKVSNSGLGRLFSPSASNVQTRSSLFNLLRHKSGTSSLQPPYVQSNHVYQRTLAIRREDASIWERRAPLAPKHVRKLTKRGVRVLVQPSNRRAYPLQAYLQAGAVIQEDISDAPVVIGVKQVPVDSLLPDKTYVYFSHTIKAQEDNMAMLDIILERNIRLIDYEKMVADNQRVVAFGKYAGIAGMINILHGLGLRLLALGHHTPFMHIGPAHNYRNSGMARQAIRDCGYEVALGMMPRSTGPLTFVFTGSGNVSQGAQEIFQELPYEYVEPKDLPQVAQFGQSTKVYGCVVRREDHLRRKDGAPFNADEYDKHPERYYSNFAANIAPFASVIVNGIYWALNSPKLLTIPDAKRLLQPGQVTPWLPTSQGSPALPHRLLAICDISADPGGSIEFMSECTTIDTPFCLYDADYNKHSDNNFSGPGVLVCSIDNMPTQIPLEATDAFGNMLYPYINDILKSDATKPFDEEKFDPVVEGAVIASNGQLTPSFEYITELRQRRRQLSLQAMSSVQKSVLVLGAGYVAGPLVDYLTRDATTHVTIASSLQHQGSALVKSSNSSSIVLDVSNGQSSDTLDQLIDESDLVVSLLPYPLHPAIARRCIDRKTNMVTASYLSPEMRQLHDEAAEAGVTIVNEVGLDPGIDHLLAKECFDQVIGNGGKITSFVSYCGGLPAPECADNALRYKFSWNPRAVLMNCTSGARWLQDDEEIEVPPGGALMDAAAKMDFMGGFSLEGYANRDSTVYRDMYGIKSAHTILRGTLRYSGFCDHMKGLLLMGLISGEAHPSLHPKGPEITWRQFLCTLVNHPEANIMLSNLRKLVEDKVGSEARVDAIAHLGLFDDEPIQKCNTPLDTMTHYLGNRLTFGQGERDVIIMRHEIGVEWPNGDKEERQINFVVYGDHEGYSAMAKCVGFPAAIAAKMVLEGEIQAPGMVVPMSSTIYHPMLKRLRHEGISAVEKITKMK
ncbi:Alpha-aminoadipic semialdehyde synthase, mitochondrial [Halotydeus destructor]|nr:Alpha-aminoadipic semialdehyde synthase, mitochondrial [Halotydeus destructor]